MQLDFEFVNCCDGIFRYGRDSLGADREVDLARSLNIPVFSSIDDIISYFDKNYYKNIDPVLSIEHRF